VTQPAGGTEDGSASVLVIALAVSAFFLAALIVLLGTAATLNARAATAADLAALAAAQALTGHTGEDACDAAERIAERNGATLTGCIARPDLVRAGVTVEVTAPSPFEPVTAEAVAGDGR
jgi:secretion/DNA translocation related TadE-like protein